MDMGLTNKQVVVVHSMETSHKHKQAGSEHTQTHNCSSGTGLKIVASLFKRDLSARTSKA
jgi:hypothetical protein